MIGFGVSARSLHREASKEKHYWEVSRNAQESLYMSYRQSFMGANKTEMIAAFADVKAMACMHGAAPSL